MITVFYDEKCGLCRWEIAFYRKRAPKNRFEWIDILSQPDRVRVAGLSLTEAMKGFYVIDDQGKKQRGVAAFCVIWAALPGWKLLAMVMRLPGVYHMACLGYCCFAWARFRIHGYHTCSLDQPTN